MLTTTPQVPQLEEQSLHMPNFEESKRDSLSIQNITPPPTADAATRASGGRGSLGDRGDAHTAPLLPSSNYSNLDVIFTDIQHSSSPYLPTEISSVDSYLRPNMFARAKSRASLVSYICDFACPVNGRFSQFALLCLYLAITPYFRISTERASTLHQKWFVVARQISMKCETRPRAVLYACVWSHIPSSLSARPFLPFVQRPQLRVEHDSPNAIRFNSAPTRMAAGTLYPFLVWSSNLTGH